MLLAAEIARAHGRTFAALLALALLYQAYMMFPYTVLARRQVEDARGAGDDNTIALLFANVLMTNRDSQTLLSIIREEEPDVVLAVGDRRGGSASSTRSHRPTGTRCYSRRTIPTACCLLPARAGRAVGQVLVQADIP